MSQIATIVWSATRSHILESEVKWALEALLLIKLVDVMEFL